MLPIVIKQLNQYYNITYYTQCNNNRSTQYTLGLHTQIPTFRGIQEDTTNKTQKNT